MENHQGHYAPGSETSKAQRNTLPAFQGDAGDDAFESILTDFETLFQNKQDSMDVYTAKVVQICNEALSDADIRHTAIASRVKTWKSAEGSIRRKKLERSLRQQLREAVESMDLKWDIYCAHSSLGPGTAGSFKSAVEMLNDLHDFGGARISLYFPGDIERISHVLAERFELVREARKHQSMDVITTLQRRLQDFDTNTPVDAIHQSHTERSFSGYKATHFHVRLQAKDIPPNRTAVWKDLLVEVQVGTLVMHAWSEIEHDMIYKPLESQAISEDEIRLLDLINGIVATGESALRQLEASTKQRRNRRMKDREAFAMSHHELGYWLEKYWVEANNPNIKGDWEHLEQVYAITKATGDHQLGRIQQILENVDVEEVTHRGILTVKMLEVMCQPLANLKGPQLQRISITTTDVVTNARYWATQLMHGLNMAMLLGVAGDFFDVEDVPARPRIASILDIIHPTRACYADIAAVHGIADYCKAILDFKHKEELLRIAKQLPRMGCGVGSPELGVGSLVPAMFIHHFITATGVTYHGDFHECQGMETSQVQRRLRFIEFYLSRDSNENVMFAIWDRLTSTSREDTSRGRSEWFAAPNLSQEENTAPWKIVTRPMHLGIIRTSNNSSSVAYDARIYSATFLVDEITSLEYRLHAKTHWGNVDRASAIARLQQIKGVSYTHHTVANQQSAPAVIKNSDMEMSVFETFTWDD